VKTGRSIHSTLVAFAIAYAVTVAAWTALSFVVDAMVLGNDFMIPGVLAAAVASMRRFRPTSMTWKDSRELAFKACFASALVVTTAWLIGAVFGPFQEGMPFALFASLLPLVWLTAVFVPVAVLFALILVGNLDLERRRSRANVSSE
jgi:hypothetical protein